MFVDRTDSTTIGTIMRPDFDQMIVAFHAWNKFGDTTSFNFRANIRPLKKKTKQTKIIENHGRDWFIFFRSININSSIEVASFDLLRQLNTRIIIYLCVIVNICLRSMSTRGFYTYISLVNSISSLESSSTGMPLLEKIINKMNRRAFCGYIEREGDLTFDQIK